MKMLPRHLRQAVMLRLACRAQSKQQECSSRRSSSSINTSGCRSDQLQQRERAEQRAEQHPLRASPGLQRPSAQVLEALQECLEQLPVGLGMHAVGASPIRIDILRGQLVAVLQHGGRLGLWMAVQQAASSLAEQLHLESERHGVTCIVAGVAAASLPTQYMRYQDRVPAADAVGMPGAAAVGTHRHHQQQKRQRQGQQGQHLQGCSCRASVATLSLQPVPRCRQWCHHKAAWR